MKRHPQRLLIMEIALSLGLLVLALSLSFAFFASSMREHRHNMALHQMTETMLIVSEDLRNGQLASIEMTFDAFGVEAIDGDYRLVSIAIEGGVELRLAHEGATLLAWPIWVGDRP